MVVCFAAAFFAVASVCAAFDITFAYRVVYNNDAVGYVATASEIDSVNDSMYNGVKVADADSYIGDTKISLSVAVGSNIQNGTELAAAFLSSDDGLTECTVLLVDDVAVCGVDAAPHEVAEVSEVVLDSYSPTECDSVSFSGSVEIERGYFPSDRVGNLGDISAALSSVDVVTVKTVSYSEEIPFTTEQTESDSYIKGYKKVTTKGVAGQKEVTALVTCVNGVETERKVLGETVVTEPVTQKELVGTSSAAKITSAQKASSKGIFIWPLRRVSGQLITSYWGDDRNHQAIDIGSPTGTPIYAAKDGVVTAADYRSDYGYYIIVDHGNGYETVYAHASKLLSSVGQVVSTGDTIALVGSTGQSTGPHLHFEVRINGTRVNPLNYTQK